MGSVLALDSGLGKVEKSGSRSQLSMVIEVELNKENGSKEAILVDMGQYVCL